MTVISNIADDANTVARLAALPPLEYDRIRRTEANLLNVRPETLDAQVKAARRQSFSSNHDEHRPPAFSDEALALRFSELHQDDLRYVAAWGRWFIWTGSVWKADNTVQAFNFARAVCREAASECNDDRISPSIASASTVAAVERLAKADRRQAAVIDQWDADPWLLNTPGGVVELRTGKMRPHRPEDYMTKITAVTPGGDYPTWREFLARITGGNGELHDYLQRAAGYSLTGSTREQALFFGYGTGGNGKGVFLNTLTGMLDDYAAVATMETFTASQSDRHPTDLAMLRGARLVTAQETEEGRRWAESRIKALTGGDPITARFMRQDFFTFQPAFKLFIAGNHKPGLRGVDEAMRRRMNLIPFTVTIPAAERDHALPEKLKAEWPGILAWAIEGCLHWQKVGLRPPAAVKDATDTYLEDEDAMGIWIKERCVEAKHLRLLSSHLYADWRNWAESAGEFAGSQKAFSEKLTSRGFTKEHGRSGKEFVGLGLKPPNYGER